MNVDIKNITTRLTPILKSLSKYTSLAVLLLFLGLAGFLVLRINQLTGAEPGDDLVAEKLKGVTRPKVDQKAVEAMENLEDQNVNVKALFDEARQNPFAE
jgi:hypothetical protein